MLDPPRRLAAALAGAGVVLCVLGWYRIAGQPTVPQQLPYLASATIPGAALLVVGLVLALRGPLPHGLERLLGGREPPGGAGATAAGTAVAPGAAGAALWRVPDGRYLHAAGCPLLDGRTDLIPAEPAPPAEAGEPAQAGLRPCPLCRPAGDTAPPPASASAPVAPPPQPPPPGSDRGR